MAMRVLVTRPLREALHWADQFRAHGCAAEVLPLIAIGPADPLPLAEAWRSTADCKALMFVSANAVEGFFAARPAGLQWPEGLRAWATGPGTTRALRAAGVAACLIDAPLAHAPQFDSEALWELVGHAGLRGARVLIVRGADATGRPAGRPWLADQLVAAGASVDAVVAYTRGLPDWNEGQRESARQGARGEALWLFSSSDSVRHLGRLMPGQGWHAACALATHERIAEAARALGFGRVEVSRPGLSDMLGSIESMR